LSEDPIIAKVKALLGERFSKLLYFMDEGDVVLARPKQLLSEETFQALSRRVEEIGGRYVNLNTGFEIPKVASTEVVTPVKEPPERSVEEGVVKEPKPVGFKSTTPMGPIPRTEEVLTTNIGLANLETGVFSPRKSFSMRYIDELAEDIERQTQFKPIIVRVHPSKPDVYQVIDGEHRVRAFRKLGRSLIRAEVRALSDEEAFFLAMQVNQLHGRRLEDLEEGLHIKKMMDEFGYTQTQIAEKFKRSQPWVSYRLRLVERLSPKTKEAFITCVIKTSHARELAELPKEDQPAVVKRVIKDKLSFKDTETLVHAIKNQPESKAEILAKPINELTSPPTDIKEFIEKHGPAQPQFEQWKCQECGAEYTISWVWCEIKRRPDH